MCTFKRLLCLTTVLCSALNFYTKEVAADPTASPINEILTNKYNQPLKPRPALTTPIPSYKVASTEIPKYATNSQPGSANNEHAIKHSIASGKYRNIYTQDAFNENVNLRYNNNSPYGKNFFDSIGKSSSNDNPYNHNANTLSSRRNINGGPNFERDLKTNSYQGQSINNPFIPWYNPYKGDAQQEPIGILTKECEEKNGQFDADIQSDVLNTIGIARKANGNFLNEYSGPHSMIGTEPLDHISMLYRNDNDLTRDQYLKNDDSLPRRNNGGTRILDGHNNIDKHGYNYLVGFNQNNIVESYQETADALGAAKPNLNFRPIFHFNKHLDYGEFNPHKPLLDYENPAQDLHSTRLNGLDNFHSHPLQSFQQLQHPRQFQQYLSRYPSNIAKPIIKYYMQTPNYMDNYLMPKHLQPFPDYLIQRNIATTKSYAPVQNFAFETNYQPAQEFKTNIKFENYCRNLLLHYLNSLMTKDDEFIRKPVYNDLSNRFYSTRPKRPNIVASVDSTKSGMDIDATTAKLSTSSPLVATSEEDGIYKVRMAEDKIAPRRLRCYACNNDTSSQCNHQSRFSKTEICLEEHDVCTKIVIRNRHTGRNTLYRRCGTRNACHAVNTMYADVESCSWCRTHLCNAAAVTFNFRNAMIFAVITVIMTIRRC